MDALAAWLLEKVHTNPQVLKRQTTTYTVANNAGESSIVNGVAPLGLGTSAFSVPAKAMGVERFLRLSAGVEVINTTGAGQTLTLKVYIGSTVYFGHAVTVPNSTPRIPTWIEVLINPAATSTSSYVSGLWLPPTVAGVAGSVAGVYGAPTPIAFTSNDTHAGASDDWTIEQTPDITLTMGAASASYSFEVQRFLAELL